MVVLMEAIHSLYDQSHGHTFSATLKLLIGSRTPTMVQLVTVYAGRIGGREFRDEGQVQVLETSVVTVMATQTVTLMDHSNDQFCNTCSWWSGAMLGARRYM